MFGWIKTKQHAWYIILTFIIMGVISSAVKQVPVLGGIVEIMIGLSLASVSLMIVRDQHFTFGDLFSPLLSMNRVLKYVILSVFYMAPLMLAISALNFGAESKTISLLVFGFVLAIISTYYAVRFMFFPFVVIEHENAKLKELMKMSYSLTAHQVSSFFLFFVLAILVNVAGMLFFVVGLLVSIPVSMFAIAHLYTKVKDHQLAQ